MLRAGLALVRAGEPAIGAVSDTLGSGPFVLERRGQDDPIQSAMNDEGKPDGSLASAMRPEGGINIVERFLLLHQFQLLCGW
jgi:hypothetical protein